MNLKLKAAFIVASVILVGVMATFVAQFLPWYTFPAIMLAFMLYIMYQLVLNKLKMDEKIDTMSKEYQK